MNKIILGDCQKLLKELDPSSINLILTDPPYPDQHADLYAYTEGILEPLRNFDCKQLVFWSAKIDFPLDYTSIHIWDKKTGVQSMYERIFERNGGNMWRVYNYYLINSTVAANFGSDIFTGHPSQKPIKLMKKIISQYTKEGDTILDPFAGSGSTLKAAKDLNRNYIGIELNPEYVKIAEERLKQEVLL